MINKIREALSIHPDQRICQCIWNRLSAHDCTECKESRMFFMPDEVFVKIMLDDSEFCQNFECEK